MPPVLIDDRLRVDRDPRKPGRGVTGDGAPRGRACRLDCGNQRDDPFGLALDQRRPVLLRALERQQRQRDQVGGDQRGGEKQREPGCQAVGPQASRSGRSFLAHVGGEPVAAAPFRDNQARRLRVGLDLAAQAAHRVVDGAVIDPRIAARRQVEQAVAAQDRVRVVEQNAEKAAFAGGQTTARPSSWMTASAPGSCVQPPNRRRPDATCRSGGGARRRTARIRARSSRGLKGLTK